MCRVVFDRNAYSVPWRLAGQSVIVRANDHMVSVHLGVKQVALHVRCWGIGHDIEDKSHRRSSKSTSRALVKVTCLRRRPNMESDVHRFALQVRAH